MKKLTGLRGFEPLGVQNTTYTFAPESVVLCKPTTTCTRRNFL
nr:MAG TPA: hypothetical protein [Caudoviricetes sp.]